MKLREAIILASGLGRRLRELNKDIPKCFHELEGEVLLRYPMRALKNSGVERFVVVVPAGYSARLKEFSEGIIPVENPVVERGNAYSLLLGVERAESERFLVSCCDSLYPPSAVRKLLSEAGDDDVVIAVSRNSEYIDEAEATKVRVEGNRVVKIGKNIEDFDAYDTGLFVMSRSVLRAGKEIEWNGEVSIFDLLQKSLKLGMRVSCVDLDDIPWTEIDTPQDYFELIRGKRRAVLERFRMEVVD
ncbi:MAG: NTP transferase domain-containing protein [Archaeoglobi archaeon]|nr:NTP transferase domain-containing protein [Candidatus Mnemosynella bozhongmuii]